jgi:hypothetical protein
VNKWNQQLLLGNAFNSDDRVICSGYDNGDVKLFDLRKMGLQWETNLANGVSKLKNTMYYKLNNLTKQKNSRFARCNLTVLKLK